MPGRATDPCSVGTNNLIENDRAHLTTGYDIIEKWMGWADPQKAASKSKRSKDPSEEDSPDKRKVISALRRDSPLSIDDLKVATGLSVALLQLEMEGRVCVTAANFYDLA